MAGDFIELARTSTFEIYDYRCSASRGDADEYVCDHDHLHVPCTPCTDD